jgi:hypothetical protein
LVYNRNVSPADPGTSKLLDLLSGKLDESIYQREQGVVATNPYADAGFHARSALSYQDAARTDELIAEQLNAESL